MVTAKGHPVPDGVKPSIVILTLWRSVLSAKVSECQKLHYKWRFNPVWYRMLL